MFSHENNITIVCPYCGRKEPEPLDESPGEEDIGILTCPNCNMQYNAQRNVSITYTTQKVKQRIMDV